MGEEAELEWGVMGERPLASEASCIVRARVQAPSDQGTADAKAGLQIAVVIEAPAQRIGLDEPEEAAGQALVSVPDSEPYVLVIHGLSRFCRLAFAGDLDCLRCLFASDDDTLICTETGEELRRRQDDFLAGDARQGLIDRFARLQAASEGDPADRVKATETILFGRQALALLEHGTLPAPDRQAPPRSADGSLDNPAFQIRDLKRRLEESPIVGMAPPPELTIGQWLTDAYRRWWDENVEPMWLE